MPQGETVKGPVQVNNDISRTSAISQSVTLLNTQGSRVTQGSLQLIPVGSSSLIYVRPFYVQGRQSGSFPQFQFVVVYSQDLGAVCAPTVTDGLDLLFSGATQTTCNLANPGTRAPRRADVDDHDHHDPGIVDHHAGPHHHDDPRGARARCATSSTRRSAKFNQADAALAAGDLGQLPGAREAGPRPSSPRPRTLALSQ